MKRIKEFSDNDNDCQSVKSLSLNPTQNQEENNDGDERIKDQYTTYDYPRPSSVYENSGDELESTALYVDGPHDFDPALREYYSNSPKTKNLLQAQVQENSDNFQAYLRKYGDGGGSTGSTESPLPQSTKSSHEDEEELGNSNWRRNSELIETQIRQDINEIDRTLELMSLECDTPNQFLFEEREYEALNKELDQINPNKESNYEYGDCQSINPKIEDTNQVEPTKNISSFSRDSPTYANVFNLTPTINTRFLLSKECRCTQFLDWNKPVKVQCFELA